MNQRMILTDLAPDFKRDDQNQEEYIRNKREQIVNYLKSYMARCGAKGLILGVSGGVDSFLAGCLAADACRESGLALRLLLLPNGEQPDIMDAQACAGRIAEVYPAATAETVNINGAYLGAVDDLKASGGFAENIYTLGNLQPRLRMMYQYALADGMLVVGTDHSTESITGFFTKYGDGGTDINPLQELVKDDIYEMSALYGAPKEVMEKKPAAGLGISADDESELGLSYTDICAYLKGNVIDAQVREKLEGAFYRTAHKRHVPASLLDTHEFTTRSSILVMDFIRAFVDMELACVNAARAIDNSIALINRKNGSDVLYIQDFHPANHCSFKEYGGIWDAHAVQETASTEFPDMLYRNIRKTVNTPLAHYNVFRKGMNPEKEEYSGFDAMNPAFGRLADNLEKHVVVLGAATEYCVLQTVKRLLEAGFEVYVMKDCLAYVSEQGHVAALNQMERMGARVK